MRTIFEKDAEVCGSKCYVDHSSEVGRTRAYTCELRCNVVVTTSSLDGDRSTLSSATRPSMFDGERPIATHESAGSATLVTRIFYNNC